MASAEENPRPSIITSSWGTPTTSAAGGHGRQSRPEDQRRLRATGSQWPKFAIIRDAQPAPPNDTATQLPPEATVYTTTPEAVALRAMGREHNLDESREQLIINGEQACATTA